MKKGNSEDFNNVIKGGFSPSSVLYYEKLSKDKILTSRHYDGNYITDYRRAVEHYYKACGCKILSTNNNWWDDCFYVWYTIPTKSVDPVKWFDEEYKDGIYWSNSKVGLLKLWGFIILLICLILVQRFLFG